MMKLLEALFEKKLIDDDRVAALTFETTSSSVEVFAPEPMFFVQVITLLALQMMAGVLLSGIIWYTILPPKQDVDKKSRSSATPALLVGYGLVIPATLLLPIYAIEEWDIRNVGLRLGCISLPMTMTLRCLAAMHSEIPLAQNVWEYATSVGYILRPRRHPKTGKMVPLSASRIVDLHMKHFLWMMAFTLIYHVTEPSGFYPFGDTMKTNASLVTFDLAHLYTTYLHATMMNMTLSFSLSGVAILASLLTGIDFDENVTNFPMFFSTSVTDFWGRRWNNLIHKDLKDGVYKPVRMSTGNRTLASVCAFVMSGLLHEYVWIVLFMKTSSQAVETAMMGKCCDSCYCDTWVGKQLLFFGWNGVLMTIEYMVGHKLDSYTSWIPPIIRSHLVVLLALPTGHLFTADITNANYFLGLQSALPFLRIQTRQ